MDKANEKAVNEILEPQKLFNSDQIDLHGNIILFNLHTIYYTI